MTHGTDRDTPTGGAADRDAADVPDGTEAGVVRDGVPQQHDARDDLPDVEPVPADGSTTETTSALQAQGVGARADGAPEDGAPEDGAPDAALPEPPVFPTTASDDDEPVGVEPGSAQSEDVAGVVEPAPDEGDDAPAAHVTASGDEADERPPVPVSTDEAAGSDAVTPAAPEPAAVAPPVAARRPLAPVAEEPLAAWPSWDDVAVAAPTAPDAGDTTGDSAGPDASAEPDAPAPDAPAPDAPAPDGALDSPASDARPDAPASHGPSGDHEATPTPLPPLRLGDLSALAFTALNAASVGVPAHALPQSPLPDPGAAQDDRSAGAGGDASRETDGAAQAPVIEEPATPGPATQESATQESAEADESAPAAATARGATPAVSRVDETAVVPAATSDVAATSDAAAAPDDATRAIPLVPASQGAWPRSAGAEDTRAVPGGPAASDPDSPDASLLDGFEPEREPRRWSRKIAVVGGAVALVAALYVGSSYALADRVPHGATVAGVEIGSMSSSEAEQHLTDELADRATSPVPVVAQEVQSELDPVAAGLELDAAATVERLTGVDLTQPVRLWRHLVGVGEQPPVTVVDEDALDAELTQLSGSLMLAPVDGTVVFADGAAHATEAVDGWELDGREAASVLEDGWLTAARPVTLPTRVVPPAVSQAETDRALAQLARPLTAAPVTVQVADRQAVLDVATLTAHAAVVPQDGILQLQLDGAALSEAVLGQLPDLLTTAADARFEFQDGAPVIIPGTPGTTLDPAALATSVVQAATTGTGRVAPVDLVQSDPAQTQEALAALGVKEVVSEFSTPLTSEPRRTRNIANGLENITGTLVRPGETFSLTEALGPVDAAHGYVEAGAIVNGEHKDAWGGGLSQVSTTTYNAAYFAGFEDVEHTPHSEWFQRYPEGREATIFTGVIDLKWKNNTPYGALVQGFVADGRAHVRIWSTKHFTVETSKSGRSGVVSPTTVYSQSPTCEPQSAGNPGFTVTNTRRVLLDGQEVDSESQTWRYKPQNKVICGTAPVPGATPAP
ncbi:VanW family protein [Cellulomonas xiejunii]|uniref:VanW family protein n=1 Tax=Cellulomonas xiejunii TaxID=2968083 RepID=A0ABY5KQQ2_9CELL|nr:VanW family protein [Cellulomonas xiejunii]MCC2322794.1 VanW family protein [Cellulomonas xiejunii]UUI72822.1 VanW family protein [Cellulomonas xiejunii]